MYKFKSLGIARSFSDRCVKIMMIVLGDDGMFWVVTPRVGERLVASGYEYAE